MEYLLTHQLELLATCAGLFNIYLATRHNRWNWFFGMVTVSLYLIIFYRVKLYADMCLQFIFLLMQFYGIYQWCYGGVNQSPLSIQHASRKVYFTGCLSGWVLFLIITYLLQQYTDSSTAYIDACTTTFSLIAQWMMSRKWIEHWYVWMVVNVISINMYFYKTLYFTSVLYGIFIVLNVIGYHYWRQNLPRHEENKNYTLIAI